MHFSKLHYNISSKKINKLFLLIMFFEQIINFFFFLIWVAFWLLCFLQFNLGPLNNGFSGTKATKKQAIRPSLSLIRFPRFAQSSGLLRRGYYPCHIFYNSRSVPARAKNLHFNVHFVWHVLRVLITFFFHIKIYFPL